MAIAVVYRAPAMTAEQYKASWNSGNPPVAPPPGLLFHAGAGEGDSFFTLSVWESLDDYSAFAPGFKAAMRQSGFEFGDPVILPVHHYLAP